MTALDDSARTPASVVHRVTEQRIHHVVVVVPARDEEARIAQALASVRQAVDALPDRVSTCIVVVADACTDSTAGVARLGGADMVVETWQSAAGGARRVGTQAGLTATSHPPSSVWIAATDADTIVPPDWLVWQLSVAEQGIVGITGTVTLADDASPRLRQDFLRRYAIRPDGQHDHVHGANMAVRADVYLRSGGWTDLDTGEDHHLWNRIRTLGPTLATNRIPVITSARLHGRAPAGFSRDMADLKEMADLEGNAR